jgi:large subunit ribosomal protein L30
MAKKKAQQLKVTLVKSRHGRLKTHRACVAGLGLTRIRQSVLVADTPENRGMINKVSYLLEVEDA